MGDINAVGKRVKKSGFDLVSSQKPWESAELGFRFEASVNVLVSIAA